MANGKTGVSQDESDRIFRMLADSSPLALYVTTDIEQRAEYISPTFTRLFGYTIEDVPSAAEWWPLAYPDEQYRRKIVEEWTKRIEAAMLTHTAIEPMEVVVTCKDGSTRNVVWGYLSTGFKNYSFGRDTTEQKKAEDELAHVRHILLEAQRIAHLGSFEYVAATRTTVWSEEEYRIYGLDPAGSSPDYDDMLTRCIHPADRDLLHETFTRAMRENAIYELEHRIVRPDGEIRWVYDRAQPYFDVQGKLLRYIGTTLDITERKLAEAALQESEERFRIAQKLSPDGFTILRPVRDAQGAVVDFTWVYANPAAEQFMGKALPNLHGQQLLELFPGHRETEFWKAYRAVAEMGERRVFEAYYGEETVAPRWFRIAVVPAGPDIAVLAQDITKRKQAEQQLARNLDAMTRLQALAALSLTESDLALILGEIVDVAIAITGADFGNIQLIDSASGDLRIAAQRGFPPWWLAFWDSVAKGQRPKAKGQRPKAKGHAARRWRGASKSSLKMWNKARSSWAHRGWSCSVGPVCARCNQRR